MSPARATTELPTIDQLQASLECLTRSESDKQPTSSSSSSSSTVDRDTALQFLTTILLRASASSDPNDPLFRLIDHLANEIVSGTSPEGIIDALWVVSTQATYAASAATPTTSSLSLSVDDATSSSIAGWKLLLQLLLHTDSYRSKLSSSTRDNILSSLPIQWLEESNWIVDEKEMQKKLRLYNTQAFYKQHRFQLLSEESQGFAKFVTCLVETYIIDNNNDENIDKSTSTKPTTIHQNLDAIRKIMGTFSLDPNRCTDLAVDLMVWHVNRTIQTKTNRKDDTAISSSYSWTELNHLLSPWRVLFSDVLSTRYLPPLLAFKLQVPDKDNNTVSGTVASITTSIRNNSNSNNTLWDVMVWLTTPDCNNECPILDVSEMLQYLPASSLPKVYERKLFSETKRIKSLGRVRLASSSSSSADTETAESEALQQQEHDESESLLLREPIMQWIQAFVRLNQFHIIRQYLEPEWWSQLCVLHPQLGEQIILQQPLPQFQQQLPPTPQVSSSEDNGGTVESLPSIQRLPPWAIASTAEVNDMDVDDDDDAIDRTLEQLYDLWSIVYESGCIVLVPTWYSRLCRFLQQVTSQMPQCSSNVVDLIKHYIVPSLSLFVGNPVISNEVWSLLQHLPYQTRYELYHSWRWGSTTNSETNGKNNSKPLWLQEGEAQALKLARYSLKRLSKDTIRDQSRAVAKVCHSYPLVVFTTILSQIESYDNLVGVMVDALRFVTPLSLDVLSFCILSRLSNDSSGGGGTGAIMVNRSRLKDDGVNLSQWLQSLESFVGAFYKRYPNVDFRGLLCYLMHRLKDGHVMEIGLLRTLLKTSAGWSFADYSPAASLSSSQLEGLSGSAQLKRETMSFGVVEATNPKASKEVRAVLQGDHNIGISLLILLAQVRHHIIFGATSKDASIKRPVKLVAHLVDTCQVLVSILLDFLTNPSDIPTIAATSTSVDPLKMYGASLPSLSTLTTTYALDYPASWMICRPLLRAALGQQLDRNASNLATGGDDNDNNDREWLVPFRSSEESHSAYRQMLPSDTWSYITTYLFESFFTYSLYDLVHPDDVYASELSRLEKQVERLSQANKTSMSPPSLQPGSTSPKNDEEELARIKKVISRLESDQKNQCQHVSAVRKEIASKKANYFVSAKVTKVATTMFLARCVYPRCMQGPDDALYCAAFIGILHQESTPGFGTLQLLDSLIVALSRSLFGLTEGEAANVSILLLEIWKLVSNWRYDESSYDNEVAGKPGAFMVVDGGGEPELVTHKHYCALYNRWHAEIGATALGCLKSPQYIHIRNCLIVLTRLVELFPTRPGLANRLLSALEPLQDESNAFADIRASAQAYGKQLIRARDDGVWKEESEADIKARQEKEQSAAAARQEQAKILMEEISREAAQISEQIGDWDGRRPGDRRRSDGRNVDNLVGGGGAVSGTASTSTARRLASGTTFEPPSGPSQPLSQSSSAQSSRSHSAPPTGRDALRGDDHRRTTQRDRSLEKPTTAAAPPPSTTTIASAYTSIASGGGSSTGISRSSGGGRDEPAGMGVVSQQHRPASSSSRSRIIDDRWPRGGGGIDPDRTTAAGGGDRDRGGGGSRKRSRPSSPVEEGEATREDTRSSKRPRADSGDEGGGGTGGGTTGGSRRGRKQRRGRS